MAGAGRGSRADRSGRHRSEALALQRQQALLANALAVLVGRCPAALPCPLLRVMALPVIPPGVPGTVLARRPDVSAAQALR